MPTLPHAHALVQHGKALAEQSLALAMAFGQVTHSETQQMSHVTPWAVGTLKGRLALKWVSTNPSLPPTIGAQDGTGAAHSPISRRVQALAHTARVGCHIASGEPGRFSRHPVARMGRWNE